MRSLDISLEERASRTAAEWLWPLVPIGVSVFCLSALIYYHLRLGLVEVRSALQVLIAGLYESIGLAPAVMFFLLALTWSSIWFVTGRIERPWRRLGRLVAMAVMLGVFLNLGDGGVAAAPHKGSLGAWLAGCLVAAFGYLPSMVLVWAVTFASLLLATDFFFSDSFERLRPRPAAEAGVETAVTDHLRGLATAGGAVAEAPAPAREATAEPTPSAPLAAVEALPAAAPDLAGDDAFGTGGDDEPDEALRPPGGRRSYFERRRHAAAEIPPAAREDLDIAHLAEWGPSADAEPAFTAPVAAPMAADAGLELAEDLAAAGPAAAAADGEAMAVEEPAAPPAEAELPEPEFLILEPAIAAVEASELPPASLAEDPPAAPERAAAAAAEVAPILVDVGAGLEALPGGEEPPPVPTADEVVVPIPRPEPAPAPAVVAEPAPPTPRRDEAEVRQRELFAPALDDELVAEAIELAGQHSRVTAGLLQRRLRIDYSRAVELLALLGARGVLEPEADRTQGRGIA
ncbi:MAG: hypothetical protein KF830_16345 [Planctomycetes bacterium]|nr:hypothetical protein [Planctomycetota bacterium]